jgi:hypothetical protein
VSTAYKPNNKLNFYGNGFKNNNLKRGVIDLMDNTTTDDRSTDIKY